MPVAITTASISPCLHVEPENTTSPALFVTGRDSPVRADCKIKAGTVYVIRIINLRLGIYAGGLFLSDIAGKD